MAPPLEAPPTLPVCMRSGVLEEPRQALFAHTGEVTEILVTRGTCEVSDSDILLRSPSQQ
ncbi:hypothetical protein M7I_5201 [Glarea lozoyensis 74030]|uniref:Uncharacterized protein n=1 Tax=Glarea lozoyensis (strain ATCC 74030 / MF5533) TaxID=1104152 RepID=H0ER83_GLAL7|nr:hypothetical protein M7I_5201 [Glarea lozoyensis 74030]